MSRRERGRPPYNDILTPAEWRVLHATQHGMSKRVIAARLHVSQDAIKYHLRNIKRKLGVNTKNDLLKVFHVPKGSELEFYDGHLQEEMVIKATQETMKIGQISRTVTDIELSANWFEVVLELPLLYTFESMAFFDCGGTRLMLTTTSPFNENESILYFQVNDIGKTYRDLNQKGVEFINVPHIIHHHDNGTEEWMAFFKDPDDRPLALMAQVKL